MAHLVVTEGIVLKKKQLLGKDAFITIFTQDLGKVGVMAKGIKSITSRRAPHVQTANLLEVELAKHGETYYLRQTKLVSALSAIKEEERKMNEVYQVFGALDRLLAAELAEGELYKQTKKYLANLARSCDQNSQDLCNYLNGMLSSLGFIDEPLPSHLIWDRIEEIA